MPRASGIRARTHQSFQRSGALSWAGCYIGANIGGGWGRDSDWDFTVLGLSAGKPHYSGVLGGGQVGCDYQSAAWVVGLAGMFDWGSIKGHAVDPLAPLIHANTK